MFFSEKPQPDPFKTLPRSVRIAYWFVVAAIAAYLGTAIVWHALGYTWTL